MEGPHIVAQVKHVRPVSLVEIEALAVERRSDEDIFRLHVEGARAPVHIHEAVIGRVAKFRCDDGISQGGDRGQAVYSARRACR